MYEPSAAGEFLIFYSFLGFVTNFLQLCKLCDASTEQLTQVSVCVQRFSFGLNQHVNFYYGKVAHKRQSRGRDTLDLSPLMCLTNITSLPLVISYC